MHRSFMVIDAHVGESPGSILIGTASSQFTETGGTPQPHVQGLQTPEPKLSSLRIYGERKETCVKAL